MWVSPGQENCGAFTKSYYQNSIVQVLVFETTKRQSLEYLKELVGDIRGQLKERANLLLIGTKTDLPDRQVTAKEGEEWALSQEMMYLEFSSHNDSPDTLLSKLVEAADKSFF